MLYGTVFCFVFVFVFVGLDKGRRETGFLACAFAFNLELKAQSPQQ
jgi:hypothetical protein